MSITIDPSGRRSVTASVEVPGSQDEVWEAIATGPGLSAWSQPSEMQLGFDGEPVRLVVHLGPHTSRAAEVRDWEPPSSFCTVATEDSSGAPPLRAKWTIEPLALGCRVQVEHSLPGGQDEWDSLLIETTQNWQRFMAILVVYLGHFSGKRGQACTLQITTSDSLEKAWETLAEPLGLTYSSIGERCKSEADAPVLAGVLEGDLTAEIPLHQALLRLDDPAPGIAWLQIARLHGWNVPTVRLYFYGEQAAAVVSREEPRWQAWLSELFAPS